MKMIRWCRKGSKRERGSSLIEMAMIVPVLMTFFIGVTEIGRLLYFKLTLNQIASEGAKFAARVSGLSEGEFDGLYSGDLTSDMNAAHWATQRLVSSLVGASASSQASDPVTAAFTNDLVSISTRYVGANNEDFNVDEEHRNTVGVTVSMNYVPLLFPAFATTVSGTANASYLYNVGNNVLVRQAMGPDERETKPEDCVALVAVHGNDLLGIAPQCKEISANPKYTDRITAEAGKLEPVDPGVITPVDPGGKDPVETGLIPAK